MKRVLSLWLPRFATDRLNRGWRRSPGSRPAADLPLATVTTAQGGMRIVAASAAAAENGVVPGLTLAEARALVPDLAAVAADPRADRMALEALADWCGCYTPWTAVDDNTGGAGRPGGEAGLWLNTSGCAHLFGGEPAMLDEIVGRLRRFGFAARGAVADTPGAAWALARFASASTVVVPCGTGEDALTSLPVAGLRLAPATVEALGQVGLHRIGDLLPLPRQALAARFGELLSRRLDQALGRIDEPLSPRCPVPATTARLAFAEPVKQAADIARATRRLLEALCDRLAASHQGARRLDLAFYRIDGTVVRAAIGTGRPTRDPRHLARLFGDKLDAVDVGFGIEAVRLAAAVVEALGAVQMTLTETRESRSESLAQLVDRLSNRLHPGRVVRLVPQASHLPERACRALPALSVTVAGAAAAGGAEDDERSRRPRPLDLLPSPEPIEAIAPVPDGPPVMFRRGRAQHRVIAAEGPERIGPEWWLVDGGHDPDRLSRIRDYYRIEDAEGRRFWVYREGLYRPGVPPRWYLHGLFP